MGLYFVVTLQAIGYMHAASGMHTHSPTAFTCIFTQEASFFIIMSSTPSSPPPYPEKYKVDGGYLAVIKPEELAEDTTVVWQVCSGSHEFFFALVIFSSLVRYF